MQYRRLGRTGFRVSVLGVGAGYLSVVDRDLGTGLFQRARDAGINYFDGRYGDSNQKLAPVIKARRSEVYVASKTNDQSGDGTRRRVEQDLAEMETDYIDNYQVRAYNPEMLAGHLAKGGSVEALEKLKAEGVVRAIGVTGHASVRVLTDAIKTGRFDTVLFPLNCLQDEAWAELIPTAQAMDVGMVIMKPVAIGLLPTTLALKWLFQQPISVAVPGVSSMEQLEANLAVAEMTDWTLTPEEDAERLRLRAELEGRVCRGCDENCRPFPIPIERISGLISHAVPLNHLRNLGTQGWLGYRWAEQDRRAMLGQFERMLSQCRALLAAGMSDPEARCPHGIRITELLREQEARLADLLQAAGAGTR